MPGIALDRQLESVLSNMLLLQKLVQLLRFLTCFSLFLHGVLDSPCKGKAIPLQAWTGPEGSRRLRLPDFKIIGTPAAFTLPPPPGNILVTHFYWGTAVAQCIRCCATNRKVAGSIPAGVIGFFR